MRSSNCITGLVKRHPDGYGFLIPDQPTFPDIYIPRHSLIGIMSGDRVEVEVHPEGRERFRGEIQKILRRSTLTVVGLFRTATNKSYGIIPDTSQSWGADLRIDIEDSKEAKDGDFVTAQIHSYPGDTEGFKGQILSIIKNPNDPLNDIERVAAISSLPQAFSKAALDEAATWNSEVQWSPNEKRKDLRHLGFVTIDGATAKDFDDAIFVERSPQGFIAWVAIADVAHYVSVGGAIDKDAYDRGTSVYFPNFVIPMLPPRLSDDLCSLRPKQARLAMVAKMLVSFQGQLLEKDFFQAIIESKARLTYGIAQDILDDVIPSEFQSVAEDVRQAADLAKILMKERQRRGSLDLEIPEVELEIDASGEPVDVVRSERLFTHKMIEELMLLANVAIAEYLTDQGLSCIYRIHEPPKPESIEILDKYLRQFGGKAATGKGSLQRRITEALKEFEHRPESQILNILALRAMSQARYSSNNVGHFGLGFSHYTHFTSPIRRYPDLIVHRLLKNVLFKNPQAEVLSEDEISTAATLLSACEQRSVKAERMLQGIKKARFLDKRVGQEFEGIISSVARFGLFVLLREYEVDGLIHIEKLAKEKLEFDEERLVLVGKRNGKMYCIGDSVKIRVEKVDIEAGKVDFELLEHKSNLTPVTTKTSQHSDKKRSSHREQKRPKKEFSKFKKEENKNSHSKPNDKKTSKKSHSHSANKNTSENPPSQKQAERTESKPAVALPRLKGPRAWIDFLDKKITQSGPGKPKSENKPPKASNSKNERSDSYAKKKSQGKRR